MTGVLLNEVADGDVLTTPHAWVKTEPKESDSEDNEQQTRAATQQTTYIVVDEVHERSLHTDFLLTLLKKSLASAPHVKVVLMSATADAEFFQKYFGGAESGCGDVPIISVEGRTFPVVTKWLNRSTGHFVDSNPSLK